ncbi:PAS domain-containing protein [Luteolibacter flavescens]|uniref:histidine kinase n=1 Tax=Luteolibacter flavescens TaxID=1859460 RepID=A0ABT3FRH9_9BACT|nr:PAS domain-containing protein [Luteolibacter flavescens]MCW1886057.1 PAS domain-containing protein [Luteolibacter flavescens]
MASSDQPVESIHPGELEKALRDARSRLDTTLAAAEIGTWEYDVVNNLVTADPNMARIFGIDESIATTGAPIEEYIRSIHPDDVEGVLSEIGRGIDSGDRYEAEYRLIGSDGTIRWVVARGRITRDDAGRAIRLPGVVVDITPQRLAELELRATHSRWHLALESAGLGAWNIDPATMTMRTDNRFRMIFHGSIAPISYEQSFAALHPDDAARVRDAVAASVDPESAVPYSEEYRVIHPDGSVHWVASKGRANFEGTGASRRLVSFDGTVSDITERKNAEAEHRKTETALRELAAKLSEADRRKDEFLATLAHELRNPLAPIRTGLEVMRMSGDKPEVVERLRRMMEQQTTQLVRLIDDLMDMSRITSGKIQLSSGSILLAPVIHSAIDAVQSAIDQAGHRLEIDLPASTPPVTGDPARIAQVVSNLLTNAVRYTNPGGTISLSVAAADGQAVIRVKDNGIGISPDMLEAVFEMFRQTDQVGQRSRGGLGIGLTLVQRLVDLHGGSVQALSDGLGHGSEFVVRLPLCTREDSGEASIAGPEMPPPAPRRILVVDDNLDAAETLSLSLTIGGNEVRTAHDGEDCIAAAAAFLPDIILMDIGMPRMDGYEAAREIRRQPWSTGMVLVALTGWGQESDRDKTRDAGFDHHLVKPVEPAALMDLMRSLEKETPL